MVKMKRKRKPMTPEQRQAASERLAKARSMKAPAKNQTIHPDVLAKPDEHPLSEKRIKSWIRTNKDMLTSLRGDVRRDIKGAKARFHSIEGYIRHMQHYLKHGDWIDDAYGEYQEKKVQWRTIKPNGIM